MRYSLEPKYRKYVQGYGFLSFVRKFGDKYGKKLMNTATKTGINAAKSLEINMVRIQWILQKNKKTKKNNNTVLDAAKIASERAVQKTAEATGDLIGNKIADEITSLGKSKNKEKENEANEVEKIYIPPEKRQQIIIDLIVLITYKMEYQKIKNLLGNIINQASK